MMEAHNLQMSVCAHEPGV